METITSIAKAVWGDSGTKQEEPASGVQGDVAKGEPYDGGNIDSNASEKMDSQADTQPGGNTKDRNTSATNDDSEPSSSPAKQPSRISSQDISQDTIPVSVGDAQQQKVTTLGPKPLATIAKENGGDAGNNKMNSSPTSSEDADAMGKAKAKTKATDDGGGDDDDDVAQVVKGTGELYIKTSGLAADGGDFDASKPGAGREADRLMEEKGIDRAEAHHLKPSKPEAVPSGGGAKNERDKPSIKERVRDKLHLHKA
ncbi:hypothetical protein E4U41_007100 [Claviceps citrina]|nr:hypothetical protein E4U41_007100 [Claviceps citrina]